MDKFLIRGELQNLTPIIKRIFFNISDCIWLIEDCHIHLGWLEDELIMGQFENEAMVEEVDVH